MHCSCSMLLLPLQCFICPPGSSTSPLHVHICQVDFHSSHPRALQHPLCFFCRCDQLSQQHRGLDDVCEVQGAAHGHQLHHHQPGLHRHRRGRHRLPHVSCLRPPRQLEIWLHRLPGGWGMRRSPRPKASHWERRGSVCTYVRAVCRWQEGFCFCHHF